MRGRDKRERGLYLSLPITFLSLSYLLSLSTYLRETRETIDPKRIMKISLDTLKVHSNLGVRNYPQ
jgi:hypothetical protein